MRGIFFNLSIIRYKILDGICAIGSVNLGRALDVPYTLTDSRTTMEILRED